MPAMDRIDADAIQASIGRPSAFLAIFERHYEVIARYLRRRLDPVLADELAAEVFDVAFSRREAYDPSQPDARPWLYGIAASLLRSHVRAEERELRELARAELLAVVEPSRRRRLTRGRVAALVVTATTLAIALALVPARFGGDQRDDALAGLPSGPILHAILEVLVQDLAASSERAHV